MTNVKSPNLPQGKLALAAVGDHLLIIDALKRLGVEAIVLRANDDLPKPVSNHADMQLLHMPYKRMFSSQRITLTDYDVVYPKISLSAVYPKDIALNCLILGNIMLCNTRYCSIEVFEYAKRIGMKIIHVNQGYARCSTAVIDEHSVITADKGIFEALEGESLDVLLIEPGAICLNGYDYGFIGGSCGKISKDKILFSGDYSNHQNAAEITSFIKRRNIEIVLASNEPIFDFGGFIPLMEYESKEEA